MLHDADKVPYRVLRATVGLEMPAFTVRTVSAVGTDVVRLDSVRVDRPDVQIPVFMWADSRLHMRRLKSDLAVALDPRKGAGQLELAEDVGRASGDIRRLRALYVAGLEGDGAEMGGQWWRFVLHFRALDPYWYNPEPVTAVWRGRAGTPFFPFRFPWALSPYGVEATEPLELEGDAESWPTYRLSGPWTRVKFTNDDTGKWWQVTRGSASGEALVVKTHPSEPGVRTAAGVNAFALLHPRSQLFPVSRGESISVEADGAEQATVFEMEAPVTWQTAP